MTDEVRHDHMTTVQLMGWQDDQGGGGCFGHHCLVCGVRFSTKLEMTGPTGDDAHLTATAAKFAALWHECC